jgi:hypothetical protein
LAAAPTAMAQQTGYKPFYIGAGGNYAIEDIDDADLDDSWGLYAKIGYHFHKLFAVQFDYNYLFGFEKGSDIDLEVMTFMAGLKGYFPVDYFIKPYVIAGLGIMYADNDGADETDYCGKIGGGLDLFVSPEFSINFETNYTGGFRDLDELRYINLLLGASFHF